MQNFRYVLILAVVFNVLLSPAPPETVLEDAIPLHSVLLALLFVLESISNGLSLISGKNPTEKQPGLSGIDVSGDVVKAWLSLDPPLTIRNIHRCRHAHRKSGTLFLIF